MLLHPSGAKDEEGMRVVPVQEILDKIERGEPVEYDHVVVEGDLDLEKIKLPKRHLKRTRLGIGSFSSFSLVLQGNPKLVSSSVLFSQAVFNGSLNFGNTIFIDSVFFSNSNFNGAVNFRGSVFNDTVGFLDSTFNGYVNFMDSVFGGVASFSGSAFNSDANFRESPFSGFADFHQSAFNGAADFMGATFSVYADFKGSTFKGVANFWNSVFNISDFSSAEFNKTVTFSDANFNNSISFNSSRFKEDPFFDGVLFNGTLYLTRTKYDRLYIRWKSIRELGYDDAAYLALLENFKKLGYVEDYDACYYEYRRLHRDQPWSGRHQGMRPWEEWLLKRIDLGLQAFYGYGKKPIWPLLWSAGTIFFFGLIWRRAGVDGGKSRGSIFERFGPGGEEKQKLSLKEQLRALGGAMLFSSTLFLSGTRLFVDPPAMPRLEGRLAAHARGFFIAERVLGAFFSILFFLSISGTIVR